MTTTKIATNFAEFAANPDDFLTIEGVPAEIATRLPGFADFGISGDELVTAVKEAGSEKGPAEPSWAPTLSGYGAKYFAQAEAAEEAGNTADAHRLFIESSFWYFFARFPHILNPAGAEAYKRHTEAYLRAARYFEFPVTPLEIELDGSNVPGFLRTPNSEKPSSGWPLVVIWGGIDVWKSDIEIHTQSEALLKRGVSILSIDMPGTGECPIDCSPTAERFIENAIAMIRAHDDVDEKRIGCYGLSFGGHWAVKMALKDNTLAGVVNNAGPIHHTFQPEWVNQVELGAKLALGRIMGINFMQEPERVLSELAEMSLISQGLLPTKDHAPLFSFNGEEDEIVLIADLDVIHEQGVKQDRLIFAHDRHVASRNWDLHEPFVAAWLAKYLSA